MIHTDEAKVILDDQLFVNIPLTKPTGKVRVKRRSFFAEYGEPIAPRQRPMSQDMYVEWQIGYDLLANSDNKLKTTLDDRVFTNYKREKKFCYELSEILYYSEARRLVSREDIRATYEAIKRVEDDNTFEETESISRTNPKEAMINGMEFYSMHVSYPLFVHRFGKYEIFAEIMIREKQRAVGSQAMLYVCLPITSLTFCSNAIGRTLDSKECAKWIIGKEEALLSLELFRVFGMLSPKHRFDVLAILEMLFPDLKQ